MGNWFDEKEEEEYWKLIAKIHKERKDRFAQQEALIEELVEALKEVVPVLCTFQSSLRCGKQTIMERIACLGELIKKAENR